MKRKRENSVQHRMRIIIIEEVYDAFIKRFTFKETKEEFVKKYYPLLKAQSELRCHIDM
jgi:hypothetical protein